MTTVPAFEIPWSRLASAAAGRRLEQSRRHPFPVPEGDTAGALLEWRRRMDEVIFAPAVRRLRRRHRVWITDAHLGGVPVAVVVPARGIKPRLRRCALIHLHGGAFIIGGRLAGLAEAIPLADRLGMRVVTVDYRQAPEFRYPAASEDVGNVYRALLDTCDATGLGLCGSSAGAVLVAQSLAWMQRRRLPIPAAAGLFAAGAGAWADGDSAVLAEALEGRVPESRKPGLSSAVVGGSPYFDTADFDDPLVMPMDAPQVLRRFPPTLLICGTRSSELSAVVHSHAQLVACGVDARLHVWEAMGHAFHNDVEVPEGRQALAVITRFFSERLVSRPTVRKAQHRGSAGAR